MMQVVMTAGTVTIDMGIDRGLGKPNTVNPSDITPQIPDSTMLILGLLSVTFGNTGQAWSKTSFAVTMLRISRDRWSKIVIWFAIVSVNLFLGLSALLFWIQCQPVQKSWNPLIEGTCWDLKVPVIFGMFAAGEYLLLLRLFRNQVR
jgi:hypothetical protein